MQAFPWLPNVLPCAVHDLMLYAIAMIWLHGRAAVRMSPEKNAFESIPIAGEQTDAEVQFLCIPVAGEPM